MISIFVKYKGVSGWNIADIKGINPLIYAHHITLENNAKPINRLNPAMKEVVKVEVLKLLDSGIIYLITNSKWEVQTNLFIRKVE